MPENNLAQNNNFINNQQNDFSRGAPVAPITPVAPKYAGFWIRLAAVFLDGIILIIPNIIVLLIIQLAASGPIRTILTDFSNLFVSWFYFILMTSKYQATLGKKALGIMVVSDTSETLSLKQVIVRETIGKFISSLILLIGYIMAGFTKRKQALHDKIAGTAVIYKNPDKKVSTGVLVAIVIAFFIALIVIGGILASIVLVSLNSARSKVQDASMKANISSVFSSAILYQDENGSLAGYKPEFRMTIANCSEYPIVNISSAGKEMAIFGKLCSAEGKYFCSDMNFDYGEVEESYAKSGKFSCSDSASLLITPAPTMITNNEIVDWKTFKSAYFGFEIKYPVDWVANENTQNISTVKDGDWWPVDTLPKNNAKISFEKTGTASIQDIINEKFGSASDNIVTADDLIDINGLIKSRQIVYTCKNCQEKYISEIDKNIPGAEGKIVLFEQGNNVLYLSLVYYKNDPRAAYFMDTFNQMVSTFEFGK